MTAAEQAAKDAFIEIAKAWDEAVDAGDVEALAEFMTDDYIRMIPDVPALVGKQAVIADAIAFFEANDLENTKNVIQEVRLADDWAYVRGSWTLIRTPKVTGEPINVSGKYMEIRERQADGSWKISRTVLNLDHPLPEDIK